MPPSYLYLDLPKHVIKNVSRFYLRAHTLVVEMATATSAPVDLFWLAKTNKPSASRPGWRLAWRLTLT